MILLSLQEYYPKLFNTNTKTPCICSTVKIRLFEGSGSIGTQFP